MMINCLTWAKYTPSTLIRDPYIIIMTINCGKYNFPMKSPNICTCGHCFQSSIMHRKIHSTSVHVCVLKTQLRVARVTVPSCNGPQKTDGRQACPPPPPQDVGLSLAQCCPCYLPWRCWRTVYCRHGGPVSLALVLLLPNCK